MLCAVNTPDALYFDAPENLDLLFFGASAPFFANSRLLRVVDGWLEGMAAASDVVLTPNGCNHIN